jgi:hypothetical protein
VLIGYGVSPADAAGGRAVVRLGMLFPPVAAGVSLLKQWFSNEESTELAGDLDRPLVGRPQGWPSRPVHT